MQFRRVQNFKLPEIQKPAFLSFKKESFKMFIIQLNLLCTTDEEELNPEPVPTHLTNNRSNFLSGLS